MPLHIRLKKLDPWNNDVADQIKVDMLNKVAEEYVHEARNELENTVCDRHPEKASYITIVPDRTHNMILRKRFCCKRFAEKITVKLVR